MALPVFIVLSTYRLYIRIIHKRRPRQLQYQQRARVFVLHDQWHPVRQSRHQGPLTPLVPREYGFHLIQSAVLFIFGFFFPRRSAAVDENLEQYEWRGVHR